MSGLRGWWAVLLTLAGAGAAAAQDAKPLAAHALPGGVVARLGQTRLRHADKATCVAFAPDTKTFVTGGDDGTVRVWSVESGEQVNLLQKPGQRVSSVGFVRGGKHLAVRFGTDGMVLFLDPATLQEVGSAALAHCHHFALSNDGKLIATTDFVGDTTVAEVESELPKLELTGANVCAFRPDGKAVAVGDANGTVTAHLVTGGKPVFTVKQDGAIRGLAYSPDGSRLAVGSRAADGTDRLCVYEPGQEGPVAEIAGMSLPQGWVGRDALACGDGSEAGVYDLAKKRWRARIKTAAGTFAVSPNGSKLAATGNGLRVRLWDLYTGKQFHAEDDTFPDAALLAGSRDGRTLFLLSGETAYRWRIGEPNAKPAGTLPGRAVAAAVDGNKLLVATPEAVVLYEHFEPTKPLPAKPSRVFKDSAGAKAVATSANSSQVAWALTGGKVIVADAADKRVRRELPVTTTTILALGFNPAADRLGVLGRDPFLRVWDVGAGRDEVKVVWKARVRRGLKGVVAFSPDGKYLTAVCSAQLVVFDVSDGKESDESRRPLTQFERYSDNGAIHQAAFTPDGRRLVVGSAGMSGRVEVWELASRKLVRTFTTGYGGISRLCVFPDGTRAASAGTEEAVTVWDLTARDEPKSK